MGGLDSLRGWTGERTGNAPSPVGHANRRWTGEATGLGVVVGNPEGRSVAVGSAVGSCVGTFQLKSIQALERVSVHEIEQGFDYL